MDDPAATNRQLLLVTLCGGGWHREMYRILENFPQDRFRIAYAYGHCQNVHAAASLPMPRPGPRFPIRYLGPTRKHPIRIITNTARFLAGAWDAFSLLRRLRPAALLTLGTASSIPLCLAARILGIPCVFVESLTRIQRLSLTGRIIYALRLADRVYVQWNQTRKCYPRAAYAGAVA